MSKQAKPLLSIGMIFKNEIRCLERCLKSLEPLRQAIPCELIMVDTGSEDGSRQIAEQYADLVVDFPWINDFSAARNVAMDRASGKWYLTIDCDEWLDGNLSELIQFLQKGAGTFGIVVQRNYFTEKMDGNHSDIHVIRIVRLSSGLRYQGRIHEVLPSAGRQSTELFKTVLHHDGYVGLMEKQGQEKRERNRSIIRTELEKNPKDLRMLMSYIDCSRHEKDGLDYILKACALVEKKERDWELFGPPIFRYAVFCASENKQPELDAWAQRAVDWFPDSFFTTIDVAYSMCFNVWRKDDYAATVRWGEMYLKAVDDLNSGRGNQKGLQYGSLLMASPQTAINIKLFSAFSNLKERNQGRALELLNTLDVSILNPTQAGNLAVILRELHKESKIDTAPLVSRLYDGLCQPTPSGKQRDERRAMFIQMASVAFEPVVQRSERENSNLYRPSYQAFLPLADQCDPGRCAAIMETEDAETSISYLTQIENWNKLPILVLEHVLELGVPFPLECKPLTLEEMDSLAGRISGETIVNLVIKTVDNTAEANWQSLIWARELSLAAVQSNCWSETDRGMELSRAFAKIEAATLPRYFGDEALKEENISTLPPVHRFGWYCVRAFEALDAGDRKGYMHLLRLGLSSCPAMKDMVEFLAANTPEIKETIKPSSELLSLAEQVRTLLASFAPGDPALEAIRSSEAYQKVAYLIEGTDAGGLPS